MQMIHPITGIAERIGRVTSQFEPGTSFYTEVVEHTRRRVEEARDRDDLEDMLATLRSKVADHLTDEQMSTFKKAMEDMRSIQTPWPVEAFKEGYQKGTGQALGDDDHAAGRSMNPDRM